MSEKMKSLVGIVGNDLKNFKTISTKRKVIYIVVAVLIVFLLFSVINSGDGSDNSGSDNALITKAFQKWISTDTQASTLYNNNNCVWDGKIGARNGDIVFVTLNLYEKNYYNQLKKAGLSTSDAIMLSGTVRMSKNEK